MKPINLTPVRINDNKKEPHNKHVKAPSRSIEEFEKMFNEKLESGELEPKEDSAEANFEMVQKDLSELKKLYKIHEDNQV